MSRIINWDGKAIKTQPKAETRNLELERERKQAAYAFQLRQEAARALCGQ